MLYRVNRDRRHGGTWWYKVVQGRDLIRDRAGRPVGCALFDSAAWKCAARDAWIGWARGAREANLGSLTNDTRFLVLPWVTVPHLASHMPACLARRIRADWQSKYGHPIHALETFVDRERFKGVGRPITFLQ